MFLKKFIKKQIMHTFNIIYTYLKNKVQLKIKNYNNINFIFYNPY
jgi:hypothetical protein